MLHVTGLTKPLNRYSSCVSLICIDIEFCWSCVKQLAEALAVGVPPPLPHVTDPPRPLSIVQTSCDTWRRDFQSLIPLSNRTVQHGIHPSLTLQHVVVTVKTHNPGGISCVCHGLTHRRKTPKFWTSSPHRVNNSKYNIHVYVTVLLIGGRLQKSGPHHLTESTIQNIQIGLLWNGVSMSTSSRLRGKSPTFNKLWRRTWSGEKKMKMNGWQVDIRDRNETEDGWCCEWPSTSGGDGGRAGEGSKFTKNWNIWKWWSTRCRSKGHRGYQNKSYRAPDRAREGAKKTWELAQRELTEKETKMGEKEESKTCVISWMFTIFKEQRREWPSSRHAPLRRTVWRQRATTRRKSSRSRRGWGCRGDD